MKLRSLFCCALVCGIALLTTRCAGKPGSTGSASSEVPHLRKQGTATQLIVDGKPFLALAGELGNNSATSVECMKTAWPKLAEGKVNTVLAGVSWAQIEPQEGKFDFSVLDGVIQGARSSNLHLALLWFASWKNGLSSYPPAWVKKDFDRFPRAQLLGSEIPWPVLTISEVPRAKIKGNLSLELLGTVSDANRDADAHAFAAMMRHVREIDGREHTVIMIQVQNEVGMQGDTRDHSPAANQAFSGPVPKELMDYLQAHKDTLIPEFRQVWQAAGFKTSGTWEEVFGKGPATDEIFMAWCYARYVGHVAGAGKAEYPIPMFVNAALPRTSTIADIAGKKPEAEKRGFFAIGGPMPDMLDVWRAGGPQVDILSPDAYNDFEAWCAKYTRSGNPLFVPESASGVEGAARAIYAFGRHDAIGYSPMGIDRPVTPDNDLTSAYDLISQLAPLISAHQGNGTMSAVLLRSPDDPAQKIQVGNYTLEVQYFNPRRRSAAPPQGPPPPAAAIFIAAGPDEYYAAGSDVIVSFSPNTPGPPLAGIATVEEGSFIGGRWVPGRSLAGDDSDEGNYIVLRGPTGCCVPATRTKYMQHFTLYRYR
jgi:Domain of unknown function (DUF5597)/Beta-galactosidase